MNDKLVKFGRGYQVDIPSRKTWGELWLVEKKQENPAGKSVTSECLDLSKCIERSVLWDVSEEIRDTLVRRTAPAPRRGDN